MTRHLLLFVALSILLLSCASSRITHSWKSGNIPPRTYNKILVLGLNNDKDLASRQRMEDHMAGDLREMGYDAVSAINEYGPKYFRDMKEDSVIDRLKNSGFDAVITIVLLDKSRERHYIPGHVYYSPYIIYQRRFWGYYMTMHSRVSPGYFTTNTRYFWESNLYDVPTGDLVYSVQTESFDPSSSESLAHEYGKLIVDDMANKNVLSRHPKIASKAN